MVKISVIISIYNVEGFLKETLDSILSQTMIDQLEVIMVDDGSTDGSGAIVDSYASQYSNFYAYHKKNEGQGIARNYGLKYARGEYVHFMDADDYLLPEAYETLYNFNPDNDFIVGNVLRFGEYHIWENVLFKNAFKDFSEDVKSFVLSEYPNVLWDTSASNKLYKREFLEKHNLRFADKKIYYEDLLFSLCSYILADSIGFSRDIFYFWRFRFDKSSITQNQENIKNFSDRITVLKAYVPIMDYYQLPESIKRVVYDKWLKHDLRISLNKIGNYSGKYYSSLVDGAIDILNIIPDDLKDDLNVYLKILYRMVENRDISSLLYFTQLEEGIKINPYIISDIDEEYLQFLDLVSPDCCEEFKVDITDVTHDDETLYIEFAENLEFVPDIHPHEIIAYLVYKNKEMPLEVNNNQIIIPLNEIKDLYHLKIKVAYMSDAFNKVSFLKSNRRRAIQTQKYDVDMSIGVNKLLYFDVIARTDNRIIIKNILFDNENFLFVCESLKKVDNLKLTNFVTFRQSFPKTVYNRDTNEFIFTIPADELRTGIIKKWELNCDESFNSIELIKKFKFTLNDSKIIFENKRNKIYIANKRIVLSELDKLKKENKKLKKENKKLKKRNDNLKRTIRKFKSRKAVLFADTVRNNFKIKR